MLELQTSHKFSDEEMGLYLEHMFRNMRAAQKERIEVSTVQQGGMDGAMMNFEVVDVKK